MPFIGIVINENVEKSINKKIEDCLEIKEENLFNIKEKNIENIKNIHFETILLTRKFKDEENLKKLIEKTNYLIVNTDIKENLNMLKNIKANIITYGFNSKATITTSSVEDEEIIICIQRAIQDIDGKIIEPQEIKMPIYENVECTMFLITILILYGKII